MLSDRKFRYQRWTPRFDMYQWFLGVLVLTLAMRPANASPLIDVSSSQLTAEASQPGTNLITDSIGSWPLHLSRQVTFGSASNSTEYSIDVTGVNHVLRFDFQHSVGAASTGTGSAISYGSIDFIPQVNLNYAFEGTYSLSGLDRIGLSVQFFDRTPPIPTLFQSSQESHVTASQVMVLGQQKGDTVNILIGKPTGVLTAGHRYNFNYRGLLVSEDGRPAASTSGYIQLTLTPEPTTWLPLVLGGLALTLRKRC